MPFRGWLLRFVLDQEKPPPCLESFFCEGKCRQLSIHRVKSCGFLHFGSAALWGSKSDASCQLDSVWFLCGSLGSNPHASFQFDLVWFLLYIQHASCQPNFFLFVAAHWAAHVYVAFHRMIWIEITRALIFWSWLRCRFRNVRFLRRMGRGRQAQGAVSRRGVFLRCVERRQTSLRSI